MPNTNHHLCIHGHFYQPPRENPWLGVIEPQESASPFDNWNERIAAECYGPLTRSRLFDEDGNIADLFDNFWQLSFNIGPTLFEWLQKHKPEIAERITRADRLGASERGGLGGAMAQAYNHPILPLCDSRDRHTQIMWGMKDFERRFGRTAEGMWLPEAAIDMNTIRALIDHGIKFVILAPQQASKVRPFGKEDWREVGDGSIDTRHPYRVYEVDGAGTTHFNRYLDVIFYNPGISLKVSFEHILSDPPRLEKELLACLDQNASLPQLLTLATDGEIYGHHEKSGNESLANLFTKIADKNGIYITNAAQYLKEYPPCWEVKLWLGPKGEGSSWSCDHGVGRWTRDCGCNAGGGSDWNQEWRTPLRGAFDALRYRVKNIYARECGKYFVDVWEARDDYISIILSPDDATREKFLRKQIRGEMPSDTEQIKIWKLLEATRNAMLMYTSCAWFFSDISGIEPVQNMCYALRAAELVQEYTDEDLSELLCHHLAQAKSNVPGVGNGADIFRNNVLPRACGAKVQVISHALAKLLGQTPPEYINTVTFTSCETDKGVIRGMATYADFWTREEREFAFACQATSIGTTGGVIIAQPTGENAEKLAKLSGDDLTREICSYGVHLRDLPYDIRSQIARPLLEKETEDFEKRIAGIHENCRDLLVALEDTRLPAPEMILKCSGHVLGRKFLAAVERITTAGFSEALSGEAKDTLAEAKKHSFPMDTSAAERVMGKALVALLVKAESTLDPQIVTEAEHIYKFSKECECHLFEGPELSDLYWRVLDAASQNGATPQLRQNLYALGKTMGFSDNAIAGKI